MGTELIRACVKEENLDVPPGFESLTSFTLKRVEDNEIETPSLASTSGSESRSIKMETEFDSSDAANISRSLRRRPWINYGQFYNSSDEESDSEHLNQVSVSFIILLLLLLSVVLLFLIFKDLHQTSLLYFFSLTTIKIAIVFFQFYLSLGSG